jgi:hypothetical protein
MIRGGVLGCDACPFSSSNEAKRGLDEERELDGENHQQCDVNYFEIRRAIGYWLP